MEDTAEVSDTSPWRLFRPIQTTDDARQTARNARNGLLAVAAMQVVVSVITQEFGFVPDVVAYAFMAYLVARTMSRAMATMLASLAIVAFILTLPLTPGAYRDFADATRSVVAAVAVYYGSRALHGAVAYHRLAATTLDPRAFAKFVAVAAGLCIFGVGAALSGLAWIGYDIDDPTNNLVVDLVSIGIAMIVALLMSNPADLHASGPVEREHRSRRGTSRAA